MDTQPHSENCMKEAGMVRDSVQEVLVTYNGLIHDAHEGGASAGRIADLTEEKENRAEFQKNLVRNAASNRNCFTGVEIHEASVALSCLSQRCPFYPDGPEQYL